MRRIKKIKCPICGNDVKYQEGKKLPLNFPFCSQRCKLVDLGKWLDEEYSLSEPTPEEHVLEDDEG